MKLICGIVSKRRSIEILAKFSIRKYVDKFINIKGF